MNDKTLDAVIARTRLALGNRCHGLGRRSQEMDLEAMLELHRHLDEFRDEQRARRDTETA